LFIIHFRLSSCQQHNGCIKYQRRFSCCCKLAGLGFYLSKLQAKHDW